MDGTDSNSTARILIEFRAFDYFSSLFLIVVSVFNVIDYDGNKIRDKEVIDYIQRVGTIIWMLFVFKYSSQLHSFCFLKIRKKNST